jgi:hypothetical protein
MKATYGTIAVKGGVGNRGPGQIAIACPGCGDVYTLRIPPFSFNQETLSIGPASIKLNPCGWHGYLTNGFWKRSLDSTCGVAEPVRETYKMANKADLKLGQHVSFLRSHNKAVSLTGTIVSISEDEPIAAVKLDDHEPEWIETAHVDDITVLDGAAAEVPAAATPQKSLVTVNNKAIG